MLAGPPIGRISTIWNQRVLPTAGEQPNYDHKQRTNYSFIQRRGPFLRNLVKFVVTADPQTLLLYLYTNYQNRNSICI
jgi:hypothetical protein